MVRLRDSVLISLMVSVSAIYFGSLPIGLPHLAFVVGLILVLLHVGDRKNSKIILWIFFLICFGLFYLDRGSSWKALVNNVSSMMMYPIVIELLRKTSRQYLVELSLKFINWTVVAFVIEASIRYILSTIFPVGSGIYSYKFHSIMFQDTNFLGLVLLVVIFFIKYLKIFCGVTSQNRNYYIAIVLLFLSLSRTAMLAWFIGELICFRMKKTNFKKVLLKRIVLLSIVGIVFGTMIFLFFYEDPSFKSKLYILDLVINNYKELSQYKVFGVGYDNATEYLGIFPHNAVLVYYLDTGIVGVLAKFIFLSYILFKTHWQGFLVLIPFFIASMSAIGYATHYLYVVLALITILSNHKILHYESFSSNPYIRR